MTSDEPNQVASDIPENIETPDEVVSNKDTVVETIQQAVDEIPDEKEKVKAIENQLRIFLQSVSLDVMTTVLEKRSELLGEEEFKKQIETPGSYERILVSALGDHSLEAARILDSIDQIEDKSLFDDKLIKEGKVILSSILTPKRQSAQGRELSGQDAQLAFAIRAGYVKRVPLYNSGFCVDIEAPTLSALNTFFTKAHTNTTEYAREFGANFFYFNDLLIKEALIELIMPLIMGSTLKNWNRQGVFIKHTKLNDLKVILNAIAALMFPDGFNLTHVCTNVEAKCTHHEELLVDITKLFKQDYFKLSDGHIDSMHKQLEVNQEKVIEYQEKLGFKKALRFGAIEFELKAPSIEDYLNYGRKFNSDLLKSNFAENSVDIYQSLLFCYYQIYTPFVESVTLYDKEGKKDLISKDPDVIAKELSRLQPIDKDQIFIKEMKKFIASTEITQICYPAVACPKCNYIPENKTHYAVDPEHAFFIMVLKKLTPS